MSLKEGLRKSRCCAVKIAFPTWVPPVTTVTRGLMPGNHTLARKCRAMSSLPCPDVKRKLFAKRHRRKRAFSQGVQQRGKESESPEGGGCILVLEGPAGS